MVLLLLVITQACATTGRRNPLPEHLVGSAHIPGAPLARMWGDEAPPDIEARVELLASQTKQRTDSEAPQSYNLLAISGGGADGAFGAGILKGWTESGTRHEFLIVTGISTGALIAPFAFIGSSYDDELENLYTTMSTSDLINKRSLL